MLAKKISCGIFILLAHTTGYAAEITLMASTGVSSMMKALLPEFEKQTGHRIIASYDTSNIMMKRLQSGEATDLIILTAPLVDEVIQKGKVAVGGRTDIAKSGIGIAIQSGKAKPDISNAEALKKTLLEASSIAYTGTGASGIYFSKLVDQLGIGEQVRAKAKTPPGGIIAEIIAKGDAEIGVQMISELTGVKGTEYIGPLPGQLQLYTVFSIGQMKNSKEVEAGKALTKFLTSPEAINVYKKQGMEAI
jgi:molybdate transport system substrate-binding protein